MLLLKMILYSNKECNYFDSKGIFYANEKPRKIEERFIELTLKSSMEEINSCKLQKNRSKCNYVNKLFFQILHSNQSFLKINPQISPTLCMFDKHASHL